MLSRARRSKSSCVYVFPAGEIPGGGSAAAVFRYPAQALEAVLPAATGVLGVTATVDPVAGQAARLEQVSTGEDGEADALAHLRQDRIGQQSGRS
jgi:hypothetical protein